MSPLRRLRSLAADPGVRATAVARIIALAGAPVTIYLAATRLSPPSQGYYFVAINVIAIAQLFELGLGTIVVQFASHEWPRLAWRADGGLDGDPAALDAATALLGAALRWYRTAAVALVAVAGVGGVLLFGPAFSGPALEFAAPWCGFVAITALYVTVIPYIAVAEGCGELLPVQRMRAWQAAALLAALWTGIATSGPLAAACLGAAAQLLVAAVWLLRRHRGLLRRRRVPPAAPAASRGTASPNTLADRFRAEQRRSARLWLSLWLAPQLLTPVALALHGGDEAGRLGVTLALALAPLTLAVAWLHGRYPSFGALVSGGRLAEFDTLARRATWESLAVFVLASAALTGLVMTLPVALPTVAARVLPLSSLLALLGAALASLLLQSMAGWLRAFRDEGLATPIVLGAAATITASAAAAALGDVRAQVAVFALAALGFAVPLAGVHFLRVRSERLRAQG